MDPRTKPLLVLLCALSFATGCATDCESNCEDRKLCTNAPQEDRTRDCPKYCEQLDKSNKNKDCEAEYDAMLECENDQDDLCSEATLQACTTQREAWIKCSVFDD